MLYEVNAPNFHVQLSHDPVFGWYIAVNDQAFKPLTAAHLTELQLDMVISLVKDFGVEGLATHLYQQRLAARRLKERAYT